MSGRAGRRRYSSDGRARPGGGTGLSTPVIEQAKGGDPEALAELYRRHVAMVFGYLRSAGLPDAEDRTAEVFVGVMRGLHRFSGDEDALRRWIMTLAHRRMVDGRRHWMRRSREHVTGEATVFDTVGASRDQPMTLDHELVEAVSRLTHEQREVIGLRFIADLSLDEVAEITGRSTTGVKALQRRGLAALRRSLDHAERRAVRTGGRESR